MDDLLEVAVLDAGYDLVEEGPGLVCRKSALRKGGRGREKEYSEYVVKERMQ